MRRLFSQPVAVVLVSLRPVEVEAEQRAPEAVLVVSPLPEVVEAELVVLLFLG